MKKREGWFGPVWRALVGIAIIGACSGRATDVSVAAGDSESHFLSHCMPGGCDAGLECLFGICTTPCTEDASCAGWSAASVCRALDDSDGSAVCDVECRHDADCSAVGPGLGCDAGRCRSLVNKARTVGFSCASDEGCAEGLRCVSNQCTKGCAVDDDCSGGARCEPFYERSQPGAVLDAGLSCVLPCSEPAPFESSHAECAALGAGGRCVGNLCVESLSGQCGDVGQPGARWACYEDLATDLFRERQAALLEQTLCLPPFDGRYLDVDFERCPDAQCADAGAGCAVNGLVLESTAMPLQIPNGNTDTIVMSALGELRLREPLRVPFELESPAERCEYSVEVRFWGLQFFDTITYMQAYAAKTLLAEGITPRPQFSSAALEGGFAQPVHSASFGHTQSRGLRAIIVEDSEANVTLLSGGSRCEAIREFVGVGLRMTLVDTLNATLEAWFSAQYDSLECTVCGSLGCEFACRRR